MDSAHQYLQALPQTRFASYKYAVERSLPYIQPRGGFPTFGKQRELTLRLLDAGADFIPLTIDSHTRHNDYRRASLQLAEGISQGRDLLNGYPIVSHGVSTTRELFRDIDAPVSLRHGTPDARLLVEIALASGITEIEGGGICYSLPYSQSYPVERALVHWQYVDRLCAEIGAGVNAKIQRESFGPLTATLVPPVITIAVQLCELLLAAEQGITAFSVSFGQTGSFEQDIALARVLRKKAAEVLTAFGFDEVKVSLVYHQWMGAFPTDEALAWQLIGVSSAISQLIGADKVVVKTAKEAVGIPDIESNAAAVRAVRYALAAFPSVMDFSSGRIDAETALIGSEVDYVMSRIFEKQNCASFLTAVSSSVSTGIIDVPFSPHRQNAGKLVAGRAKDRSIRLLAPASVPISAADLAEESSLFDDAGAEMPLWAKLLSDIRILT